MADYSFYRIADCDIERTPNDIRFPRTLAELLRIVAVERQIPDDVEVYFVIHSRLFTVGDLRREMERH